jgi:putative endonuclease
MNLLQAGRLRFLERTIQSVDRLGSALGRESKSPKHLALGHYGEEAAYFFLRRHGFVVVARRWKSSKLRGDLDLVAWEGETLCFVEVKTRGSRNFAAAEAAIDDDKMQMLRRMARQYLHSLSHPPQDTRFDVVSVYVENRTNDTEIIRGAFDWY